jgi:hypothetical protein
MRQFALELLRECLCAPAFFDFSQQIVMCSCQLKRTLGHAVFERVVEIAQIGHRLLLRPEIATDRCNIHGLVRARIVDPKPIDEEGYRSPRLEMMEFELSYPSSCADYVGPTLFAGAMPILDCEKVQDMSVRIDLRKPDKLKSSRVQIPGSAIHAGKADEIR